MEYMRPYSPQQQLGTIESLTATSQRPPVAPGGQTADEGQAFQVFLPPQAQLKELQEELDDNNEPDGAENFLAMINEEMDESDTLYPPLVTNPIALANHMAAMPPPTMGPYESGGVVEEKPSRKASNKKSVADKKKQKEKRERALLKPSSEPDPEVKGFDGFFLYWDSQCASFIVFTCLVT